MTTLLLTLALLQTPSPEAQTRTIATEYLNTRPVAGIAIAVIQNGELKFAEGFGYQNRETKQEATAKTRFRLASVSKPITAVAIMKLVEEGKIDLDADVRRYVPEWPEKPHPVTLRQILTHSSGIRHYAGGNEGAIFRPYTPAQAIALFSGSDLLFTPGTQTTYSTHAFTVAARAVETASGQTFAEYLKAALTNPAGITDLALEDLSQPAPANRSQIYVRVGETGLIPAPRREDISWKSGGGGMEASALDLARFGQALLEGKILKPATLNQMWTAQKLKDGKRIQSLGWAISPDDQTVSHSGSQQGSRTNYFIHRPTKTIVAILTNTSNNPLNEIDRKIYDLWVNAASQSPKRDPN